MNGVMSPRMSLQNVMSAKVVNEPFRSFARISLLIQFLRQRSLVRQRLALVNCAEGFQDSKGMWGAAVGGGWSKMFSLDFRDSL